MKQLEHPEQKESATDDQEEVVESPAKDTKKRSPLLAIILFLIVIGVIAAGGYLGWQEFLKIEQDYQSQLDELNSKIGQSGTSISQLKQSIRPLAQSVGKTDERISQLEQQQQNLATSTEKLYELYGRDENGWKLSEVEYLMSIAQHKLVLENDFEGAAKTLNVASEKIAELADPGLLVVRVKINEEIAQLKTRVRPDLVGMTLLSARLTRQIGSLKPGYQVVEKKPDTPEGKKPEPADDGLTMDEKLIRFVTSLVTINTSKPRVEQAEQTAIIDVTQKLEDNLKLTRWSILERDAFQFKQLMQQNVDLFKQYYDLENAANADFYDALLQLQKSSLKPELPDITGSLLLLKEIQKKRETATQPSAPMETENG